MTRGRTRAVLAAALLTTAVLVAATLVLVPGSVVGPGAGLASPSAQTSLAASSTRRGSRDPVEEARTQLTDLVSASLGAHGAQPLAFAGHAVALLSDVRLVGRIVDVHGRPVAGADVRGLPGRRAIEALGLDPELHERLVPELPRLKDSDAAVSPVLRSARSSADGRFELVVPVVSDGFGAIGSETGASDRVIVCATTPGHAATTRDVRTDVAATRSGPDGDVVELGDLELLEAGRVVARVVDEDGRPVAGVEAAASHDDGLSAVGSDARSPRWSARWVEEGVSRQDGSVELARVRPGRVRLDLAHEARASLVLGPIHVAPGRTLDLGDVRLPLGAAISGRVVDADGAPVTDAFVTLSRIVEVRDYILPPRDGEADPDPDPDPIHARLRDARDAHITACGNFGGARLKVRTWSAHTDLQGRFVVGGLEGGSYSVLVSATGLEPAAADGVAPGDPPVTLRLRRTGRITLHLVTAQGSPARDVEVQAYRDIGRLDLDDFLPVTAVDGVAGAFVVEGVCSKPLIVRVSSPARGTSLHRCDGLPDVGRPGERQLVLPEVGGLGGRVVDESGAPVGGASVRFSATPPQTPPFSVAVQATTEADGSWHAEGLPPGTVMFRVAAAGRAQVTANADVDAGVARQVGDVVVARAGVVEGLVQRADGRPAVGARLRLTDTVPGSRRSMTARCDALGAYRVAASAGSWSVQVEWPSDVTDLEPRIIDVVADASTRCDVTLPKGGRVEGRVVAEGLPVAGATVTLLDRSGARSTSSDAQGAYSFDEIVPGGGVLWAAVPGGGASRAVAVDAEAGQLVEADLALGTSVVEVYVRRADTWTPLPSARICGSLEGVAGLGPSFDVTTGADGGATVRWLLPGTWRLEATHPGGHELRVERIELSASTPPTSVRFDLAIDADEPAADASPDAR